MKVRWNAEPRALADPQVEVKAGDVIDVSADVAASLVEQGVAESVVKKESK